MGGGGKLGHFMQEAWTVCRFRGPGKREGVVFLRGVDTPMHTMI